MTRFIKNTGLFLFLLLFIQCNTIEYDAEIRHKISGFIVDGDGIPLQGARVGVSSLYARENFVTYTTTQNGEFQGIIPGSKSRNNQFFS